MKKAGLKSGTYINLVHRGIGSILRCLFGFKDSSEREKDTRSRRLCQVKLSVTYADESEKENGQGPAAHRAAVNDAKRPAKQRAAALVAAKCRSGSVSD